MTHYEIVNISLTIATIIGQAFILVVVLAYIFKKERLIIRFFGKHGILIAFLISLIATLGSLYYSEITEFQPCTYCWYQRIFMYPQVVLLGMALWRRSIEIIPYSMGLAIVGGIIAFRHYLLEMGQNTSGVDNCELAGGVSCADSYFVHLGYITIAMLSLTSFVITLLLLYLAKHHSEDYAKETLQK